MPDNWHANLEFYHCIAMGFKLNVIKRNYLNNIMWELIIMEASLVCLHFFLLSFLYQALSWCLLAVASGCVHHRLWDLITLSFDHCCYWGLPTLKLGISNQFTLPWLFQFCFTLYFNFFCKLSFLTYIIFMLAQRRKKRKIAVWGIHPINSTENL